MGDKLVRTGVFPDNRRLPGKVIGDQPALELLEFRAEAAVDGAPYIRDVLPCIHPVAPVIEPERRV